MAVGSPPRQGRRHRCLEIQVEYVRGCIATEGGSKLGYKARRLDERRSHCHAPPVSSKSKTRRYVLLWTPLSKLERRGCRLATLTRLIRHGELRRSGV